MSADVEYLTPLLVDESSLAKEKRRRAKAYDYISVGRKRAEEELARGWEFDRKLKRRVRLRRLKGPREQLENRFWTLLFKLGYPELNSGRRLVARSAVSGSRSAPLVEVPVFAKDDETVVVAWFRAESELAKKGLSSELEGFASSKGVIAKAIKAHYGAGFKPKIVWMFVTSNVVWSASDVERAASSKIQRVTERELLYFSQIAGHLGPAARYQFLAEYLGGQKIPALSDRVVPAIRGKLGGLKFYSFVSTPGQLLKIAFVNHRSLQDPRGVPTYQRLVSRGRLRHIRKFLEGGGFFPTNILVNFPKSVRFDIVQKDSASGVTFGYLYLPDRYKSAWIIDGQHRLYGYSGLSDDYLAQNLAVIAFEGMSTQDEANLFVTINHEQKSVPRSLLDDLEGDLRWGSEVPRERLGAVAARLIQILNNDIGGPLYGRVTAQGIRATSVTSLTVAQVKEGLKRAQLLGAVVKGETEPRPGPLAAATDQDSLERARLVLNKYFSLVRDANPALWDLGRDGLVCTNVGIQGLLAFLMSAIQDHERRAGCRGLELSVDELMLAVVPYLRPVLKWLEAADQAKAREVLRVPYGTGGRRQYHYRLCRIAKAALSHFEVEGYGEWEVTQSEERIQRAENQIKEITVRVQEVVFSLLKKEYGEDDYFEKGVTSVPMRTRAFEKSQAEPKERRLGLEHYLDFLDYKKIVDSHWSLFREAFDIPEAGRKGRAKNLTWMDKVNELRRIPAHPTRDRQFALEDFRYLDWIHGRVSETVSS